MDHTSAPMIYTVGHSNATTADFIALLRAHGIGSVVDVRSAPYSRFASHFNREAIAGALSSAGIDYAYAGEYLGGRPQDPTCYKHGKVPAGKANYLKLVDYPEVARRPWFLKGLERLMQIASERPTAIMCSEEDPHHCHRYHLITPALEARGVTVTHIRHREIDDEPAGDSDPRQMTLF